MLFKLTNARKVSGPDVDGKMAGVCQRLQESCFADVSPKLHFLCSWRLPPALRARERQVILQNADLTSES